MLAILRRYADGNYAVTEYTKDGETVSHTIRAQIPTEPAEPPTPTLEEMQAQTLLNTEFLVILAEITQM